MDKKRCVCIHGKFYHSHALYTPQLVVWGLSKALTHHPTPQSMNGEAEVMNGEWVSECLDGDDVEVEEKEWLCVV